MAYALMKLKALIDACAWKALKAKIASVLQTQIPTANVK